MKPTWEIIHGDCLDVLPKIENKSIAHIITDPPYEAEAHTDARRVRDDDGVQFRPVSFVAMTEDLRKFVAVESTRVCIGWSLVFCQIEGVIPWRDSFLKAGAKWRRAQIWVKPDSTPNFSGDRPAQSFESIATVWCGKGRSVWNGGGGRGHYIYNVDASRSGSANEHPTTKPVPLMMELVERFTNPGDTILDPFCGSGSTGVACIRLGRNFIGIEKDETYAKLARERLAAEASGQDLRSARSGQTTIFDLAPVDT